MIGVMLSYRLKRLSRFSLQIEVIVTVALVTFFLALSTGTTSFSSTCIFFSFFHFVFFYANVISCAKTCTFPRNTVLEPWNRRKKDVHIGGDV